MARWSDTEDSQDLAEASTALAAAASCTGDHTEALAHAGQALAQADSIGLRHDGIRWAWPIFADAALGLTDHGEVARLLEWLDKYPPGHIPTVLRAERERVRARLFDLLDDPGAGAAYDMALKAFRRLGSPYHLAVGLLDYAEHLAAAGDAAAAQPLAAEANSIGQRLGARPLLVRAARLGLPEGLEETVSDAAVEVSAP